MGGREFAIIRPNHGTRLRPQCAWKSGAPARAPRGGGAPGARGTAPTPSLRLSLDFQTYLQQPGRLLQRAIPPPRKYQGWSGKITKNPTSASTGCPVPQWKNSRSCFTRRNQIASNPISPASQRQEDRAHLRHPTNWGLWTGLRRDQRTRSRPPRRVGPVAGP